MKYLKFANIEYSQKKPLFNLLEEIEVNEHLVFKKEDDNGPFVLVGGKIDALIIHATGHKKSDSEKFNTN